MTGKEKLTCILNGRVPESPPHWELVFQIGKEMMGIDTDAVRRSTSGSEASRNERILEMDLEIQHRLIAECDWAAAPCHKPEHVSRYQKEFGGQALIVAYDHGGVFWMPPGDQLMRFVERLFDEPEGLHAEARMKCDTAKRRLTMLADQGVDFFVLAYDFGFNDAPFVSPRHFREFIASYLAEMVQHAHALGRKAILHSDGCLNRILDQIHATGIDGYQSVDPQGQMDIQEVRSWFPDWILMGNVACNMLQDADEERIREEVRRCMSHGGIGKRYIFSTSNCIYHGMPPENYRIMLDEYRTLCRVHEEGASHG